MDKQVPLKMILSLKGFTAGVAFILFINCRSLRTCKDKDDNFRYEPRHEISNNVVCATSKGSDQPAPTRSLIRAIAGHFNIL